MLTEQGLATTLAEAKATYQGMLLEEVLSTAQSRLGRALPPRWLDEYERRRAAVFDAELQPVRGARELVRALLDRGQAICVASQGRLEKTDRSLSLTGLDELLRGVLALLGRAGAPRKAPPGPVPARGRERWASSPRECVVVEDTPSGVAAGRSAGMRVFGYAGETDATVLELAGAEVVLSLGRDRAADWPAAGREA